MSSYCYGGYIRMNPEVKEETRDPMFDGGYPYSIPKVYLDGVGESYFPQMAFSWGDDSVIVVRDKCLVKYTHSSFVELLAKNEEGEVAWIDGRTAPYSCCWEGEYLNEAREAQEYTVEEYNLETCTKKKYKVVLEEEELLNNIDLHPLSAFLDEEAFNDHFHIKDGVLLRYLGKNKNIVIPDGVREIGFNPFMGCSILDNVKIPKTVEKISCSGFDFCFVKHIEVDADNPKYYSQDGLLIDRETKTLVWAYAGNVIPTDSSVKTIGVNAFCGRTDIREITVPDAITTIENEAFRCCYYLEEVKIPDAFVNDAKRIFGVSLVKDGDKYLLEFDMDARYRHFKF